MRAVSNLLIETKLPSPTRGDRELPRQLAPYSVMVKCATRTP